MEPKVIPIYHASLILEWVKIIYVDSAWNINLYKDKPNPDLVLITDTTWTMSVDQAISVILEFKPKKVYSYYYRGEKGFSDVNKFKELVEKKQ
jgi:hypothetical protein